MKSKFTKYLEIFFAIAVGLLFLVFLQQTLNFDSN